MCQEQVFYTYYHIPRSKIVKQQCARIVIHAVWLQNHSQPCCLSVTHQNSLFFYLSSPHYCQVSPHSSPIHTSSLSQNTLLSFQARGGPWMSLCACGPRGAALVCPAILDTLLLVLPGSPWAKHKESQHGPSLTVLLFCER